MAGLRDVPVRSLGLPSDLPTLDLRLITQRFDNLVAWASQRVQLLSMRAAGTQGSGWIYLPRVLRGEMGDAGVRAEIRDLLRLMAEAPTPEPSEPAEPEMEAEQAGL